MKRIFIILVIILFIFFIVGSGTYLFIFPPRVISVSLLNQAQNVALDSSLIIKFDNPVKRQALWHNISPPAYGEWEFEDPLIKSPLFLHRHLFRTLIFTPAIDFEPNTQYQIELKNIISPIGIGPGNSFSFIFKTQKIPSEEISQEKIELEKQPEVKITLLDIPLDWQDHSLSCEAASLKMTLADKGVYVSEKDIMERIGYDLTPRRKNVWGDPYQTYVGNIDGKICSTGYGVYWTPVAEAANYWREAEAFSGWTIEDLIKEIQAGNPVIVWGTLPVKTLHDCSWYTPEGKYIKAFRETHVRVVVGFTGKAENPSKIILNDPLAGRLYWPPSYFLTNWGEFDRSGVVVR